MGKTLFIFLLIFLAPVFVFAEMEGKIAIAVEEKAPTAKVSQKGGRSPYFLIFDQAGRLLEIVDNPHKTDRRRAGPSVVAFLSEKGVTFIAAAHFGGKMAGSMHNKGIGSLEFQGTAEEALKRILAKPGKS